MTTEEYIKLRKQYLEIENALRQQDERLQEIKRGQSWWMGLSSNLAGNAIWDGLLFVGSRLLK